MVVGIPGVYLAAAVRVMRAVPQDHLVAVVVVAVHPQDGVSGQGAVAVPKVLVTAVPEVVVVLTLHVGPYQVVVG